MKSFNEIFFNQYYKDNKCIQYKNDDENIFKGGIISGIIGV